MHLRTCDYTVMIFSKFGDLHKQSLIVLGMVHAQIKEHVMMQQEPVFASKGLKDFQAHAKVNNVFYF